MSDRSLSMVGATAPAVRPDHSPGSPPIGVTALAKPPERVCRFRQREAGRLRLEAACALAALLVMVSFHHRITAIQRQSDEAAAAGSAARQLLPEFERAQDELALLRDALQTDHRRTRAMMDACMHEVRAVEDLDAEKLVAMQTAVSTIAGQLARDPTQMTRAMLLPTVQLSGDDTVGSGTLVFSGVNPTNEQTESYALTSLHVVRNILGDKPSTENEHLDVTVYLPDGKVQVKGDMVANNAAIDAALVRLQTDRVFPFTASVYPREGRALKVWDAVCAVGCPLGNDPVPSQGEISSLQNEINGSNYWMINAPTYFGNSGGGIYLGSSHQLIGVFSKIYTHGRGNPVVVPHMGLCTPIDAIYEWLVQEGLVHLLHSEPHSEPDLQGLAARTR
jgi:S1-C subfamily serine protease